MVVTSSISTSLMGGSTLALFPSLFNFVSTAARTSTNFALLGMQTNFLRSASSAGFRLCSNLFPPAALVPDMILGFDIGFVGSVISIVRPVSGSGMPLRASFVDRRFLRVLARNPDGLDQARRDGKKI